MKKVISLLLTILMIMPDSVMLAEMKGSASSVSISGNDGYPGSSITVVINANEFEEIGSLDLNVYYDSNLLILDEVVKSDLILSTSHLTDINTNNVGQIITSSVFTEGLSGSGCLFEAHFTVSPEAGQSDTEILVMIGDVYDISLDPVVLSGTSCTLHISGQKPESETMLLYSNSETLEVGEVKNIDLWTDNTYNMAAADFIIEYDSELLNCKNVAVGEKLKQAEGAQYDINRRDGYIKISYICLKGINDSVNPLLTLQFESLADEDTETVVTFTAESIYNAGLEPINGSRSISKIQLKKKEAEKLKVTASHGLNDDENHEVIVHVPGDTNLAAGDFTVSFDKDLLTCTEVRKTCDSGSITYNIKNSEGQVKFSYINTDGGLVEDSDIVTLVFTDNGMVCTDVSVDFELRNPVNDALESLDLLCEGVTFRIHSYQYQGITWRDDNTAYAVFRCINEDDSRTIECAVSSAHTEGNCTEPDVTVYTASVEYKGTSYTDTKQVTIPAPGHDYAYQGITWRDDNTAYAAFKCSVCGDVHEEECAIEIASTDATCTTAGNTVYNASVVFEGKTYTDSKSVEGQPLGHNWGEPVWSWNADHTQATATFTCKNDPSHTYTTDESTATVTETPATYEADGKKEYTVTVTGPDGKEYTETYEEKVPALEYEYEFKGIEWNEDHTAAEATYTDEKAGKTIKINAVITSEKTLPTCETSGKIVYTATISAADSPDDKAHTETWTEELPALGHNWGEPVWNWNADHTKATATFTCKNDPKHTYKTEESKSTVSEIPATYESDGKRVYTVTVTGPDGKEYTETYEETIPALQYDYQYEGIEWSDDNTKATLTYTDKNTGKKETAEAEVTVKTTSSTCTEDGKTVYTATVSADKSPDHKEHVETREVIIPKTGHNYGEWKYDGEEVKTHTHVCANDPSHTETQPCEFDEGVTEGDITTYTCKICGGTYSVKEGITINDVIRIAGANRFGTSQDIALMFKQNNNADKLDAVILANGDNFADALAGSYLAAVKNAPIIITRAGKEAEINAYIRSILNKNGTIYVLGGTAAVPESCLNGLTGRGYEIERIAGNNRYLTNLAILDKAGVSGDTLLIATGTNYADSLSASATGLPMLLVKDSLSDEQRSFLREHRGMKLIILGGTNAVNSTVESQLGSFGEVSRISGANRAGTSLEIAKKFFPEATTAVIAYSHNFPDGLCGGPLANQIKSPLILTRDNDADATASYMKSKGIKTGYVLGGTSVLTDSLVRKLYAMRSSDKIIKFN